MLKQKTEAVAIGTGVQKARAHVEENKNVYIAAGLGMLAGALLVLMLQKQPVITINTNVA